MFLINFLKNVHFTSSTVKWIPISIDFSLCTVWLVCKTTSNTFVVTTCGHLTILVVVSIESYSDSDFHSILRSYLPYAHLSSQWVCRAKQWTLPQLHSYIWMRKRLRTDGGKDSYMQSREYRWWLLARDNSYMWQ